ncbi:hypothetical protein [Streptomyces lateritius]|uniref:hypothetical protein n=1 Tax=Streptomyces lateritius TaxID=67313 RepID=UPI001C8B7042|nr:hypothetical protein [Streptomyces lateritius]MBX9423846.1 hypothetical protein [Streptomyces lateritius]
MGKKKSGKLAADQFRVTTRRIRDYLDEIDGASFTDQAVTWAYESALIKTSVAFEKLMLECLVVALNKNTQPFSEVTGTTFPKHLNQKVCEYLITGGGYFDFKGRGALIGDMKKITGDPHYLLGAVGKDRYYHSLELLFSLRNYAAHESPQSKEKVRATIFCSRKRIKNPKSNQQHAADFAKAKAPTSAGAWLKRQNRLRKILDDLEALAGEIHAGAPH